MNRSEKHERPKEAQWTQYPSIILFSSRFFIQTGLQNDLGHNASKNLSILWNSFPNTHLLEKKKALETQDLENPETRNPKPKNDFQR
jgi:hypothetical protein